ncbi:hypothetical protein [Streptomyces sp. NPDC018000]|uniref:hypothetical protein n=1 Tax=Streptomyces sp. NPDC018000 TaxID=3365028 RepID=UPI0037A16D58
MYLVHVRILLAGLEAQDHELREVFLSHATAADMVEHLSVHPEGDDLLTVGFWIGAPSAVASEKAAYAVARRVLEAEARLRHGRIRSVSCTLVPAVFDQMLQSAQEPGRNVRRTDQASGEA